jgi:hypothetical protein
MFEFDKLDPELEYNEEGIGGAVDDDGALIWDEILLRICWDNMPTIQYSSTIIWGTVSDWNKRLINYYRQSMWYFVIVINIEMGKVVPGPKTTGPTHV